jgi:transposase
MDINPASLPDDVATLKAMLIAATKLADTRGQEIETLKLTIAKLRRDKYGASSERGRRLLEQLELQLGELEETRAQNEAEAEIRAPPSAPAGKEPKEDKERRKPARRPLPANLPRERVVHPAPSACPCCCGAVRKLVSGAPRPPTAAPRARA